MPACAIAQLLLRPNCLGHYHLLMWLILDNLDSFGGFLETVIFIGHTGGAFYAGFVTTNVEIQKHA